MFRIASWQQLKAGTAAPAEMELPDGVAAVVEMTPLFAFNPEAVVIHVGDTVEWRNRTLFTHTVTANASKAADAANVALPPGAAEFDSGEIERGAAYQHRFTVAGTYGYVCLPHEGIGMTGTVYVLP